MENVTQQKTFLRRQLEAFRLSIGAAAAIITVLMPGPQDAAFGQGAGGFLQPTITADYLKAIRRQAQEYDEARNQPTDPREDLSRKAPSRADDYGRSLFDFSRTEAARPRQYTTYDEITRPSLFPGSTGTPETTPESTLNQQSYEDYYSASRRNDPRSSLSAADLAASRENFNPYEDFQQNLDENPYRIANLQAGASAGRFGAQTVQLSNRALQPLNAGITRGPQDNINVGLVKARLGAIAGLTYTDNATFQTGPQKMSDLIGQIGIKISTRQQITKDNMLNFQLGVGYTEYLLNPELNDLIRTSGLELDISPTSRLAWETSFGSVFVSIFDSFGVSQRREEDFLAAQETEYQSVLNTLGIAASWQANRTTSYTASLSRTDRMALDPIFSTRDTVSYNFVGDIEYSPGQEWIAGRNQIWIPAARESWVAGLSTSLSQNERPNETAGPVSSTTVAIGPHITTPVSRFTRIRVGGGLQFADFEEPETGKTNATEPFLTVDVINQLNRFTSQSLRFGHESGLNDITNAFVADFVRHSFAFNISPRTNILTTAYWEFQSDTFGTLQEELVRTGAAINLQHRLNSQVTLFLGYNYGQSDSTLLSGTVGTIRDPNDPTLIRNAPGTDVTQETFTFDIAFPFARDIDLVLGYRRLRSLSSDSSGNFVENRGSINFSYNF